MVHTEPQPGATLAGEGTAAYTVAAVARALDVLCAFERPPHELSLAEIQLRVHERHARLRCAEQLAFRVDRHHALQFQPSRVGG